MKTTSTNTENQPIHRIRHGVVSASIWRQETDKGPLFNVAFQRSYKEGNTWRSSNTFGQNNLLVLSLVATHTFEWISAQYHEPEA